MLKKSIKSALKRIAPEATLRLSAMRSRRHAQRLEAAWGLTEETRKFVERYGSAVLAGPFAGMTYPAASLYRHVAPKLLGTYELELHPFLVQAIAAAPTQVIDVGCAEGYYAVGLARCLQSAAVHAFDADPWARKRTSEMARQNGCANLQVHSLCNPAWLSSQVRGQTLVIMDCEGCEAGLTAGFSNDEARLSWWVIELHETPSPGVTQMLSARFEKTHSLELCDSRPLGCEDMPALQRLNSEVARSSGWMEEHRESGQQWLLCRPKTV
jgi:hypothetical protein